MWNSDDETRGGSARNIMLGIICVTVLFFLLKQGAGGRLENILGLSSGTFHSGYLWQLFSALLVNYDGFSLFFEMFALYVFGSFISGRIGGSALLGLYVFCGVFGNALFCAVHWGDLFTAFGSCRGAVTGIIMASALMAPDLQVFLLFVPFPVKLRTMAVVFLILNVVFAMFSPVVLLDVGGFIGAYLFLRLFHPKKIEWDLFSSFRKKKTVEHPTYTFVAPQERQGKVIDKNRVDRILEKLSRTGINSLTEEEIHVLEVLREKMKKRS